MVSHALQCWQREAQKSLDEIERAHQAVGGAGRGRRHATQQINQAYVVLLSSQFQRFCRDLHSEAVDYLTTDPNPNPRYTLLRIRLTEGRKLDSGNPNPGNLGSDFGRFQMEFWKEVLKLNPGQNKTRQAELDLLNVWRNAIAHQDFDPAKLGGQTTVRLSAVRKWRATCNDLAVCFDEVVKRHLSGILGVATW